MGDRSIRDVLARIACALALVMLGFTGQGLAAADDGPFAAQYRLPDGSYASLCHTQDDAGALPHAKHHCDLCFAAAGHAFMPPAPISGDVFAWIDAGLCPPVFTAGLKPGTPGHGLCRGPPAAI